MKFENMFATTINTVTSHVVISRCGYQSFHDRFKKATAGVGSSALPEEPSRSMVAFLADSPRHPLYICLTPRRQNGMIL